MSSTPHSSGTGPRERLSDDVERGSHRVDTDTNDNRNDSDDRNDFNDNRNDSNGRRNDSDDGASAARLSDRRSVVAREKEKYGGIKWGSAFFGWLTATGTAVILTAVLVAAGAVVGVSTDTNAGDVQGQATENAGKIGIAGGIVLLAVLLIAYYCGGYVAGRMARFNGIKQGIAVWVWAIVIAILVAVAGAVLGSEFDILDRVGGFPRLPVGGGDVTTGAIIALVIALVAALVGAILGGLAGMRFHRKVDKAGLGH